MEALNFRVQASTKALNHILDKLLTVTSLIVVPVLVASTLVWSVDKPPRQDLWLSHDVTVSSGTSTVIPVGLPVTITMPMRRGRYWIQLEDAYRRPRYVYPTQVIPDTARFDFQNLTVTVPDSLPKGSYNVVVHIAYWFNPFKDGQTAVRISSLTVK